MKGNIYGVDVKLMPPDDNPTPIVIELNGSSYGTDFFRYEEGFEYYRKYARVLGARAEGKPIFMPGYFPSPTDPVDQIIRKQEIDDTHIQSVYRGARLVQQLGPFFGVDLGWVNDWKKFELEHVEKEQPDPEDLYHQRAAQEEGIPFLLYDEVEFGDTHAEFTLMNGKSLRMKPEEIGLIHSASDIVRAPSQFQSLFLSSPLIEWVESYKPLVDFVDGLAEDLEYTSLKGGTYGVGLYDADFTQFVDTYPYPLFAKKAGGLSGGIGVEFVNKKKIKEELLGYMGQNRPVISVEERESVLETLSRLLLTVAMNYPHEFYLTQYQPFVPSVELPHPKTGKMHDGCARSVVYSPPDGEPIVLGTQWRLAPSPLEEIITGARLEDLFRANLCRGATPAPMSVEHELLVNKYAIGFIKNFEKTLEELRTKEDLVPAAKERISEIYNATPEELSDVVGFRYMFWYHHMQEKAERMLGMDDPSQFYREVYDRTQKIRYRISREASIKLGKNLFID